MNTLWFIFLRDLAEVIVIEEISEGSHLKKKFYIYQRKLRNDWVVLYLIWYYVFFYRDFFMNIIVFLNDLFEWWLFLSRDLIDIVVCVGDSNGNL